MYLLETKNLPIEGTLVITKDGAVVQDMLDETTLCECVVPLIHSHSDAKEVAVVLEDFFKTRPIMMIDEEQVHFGNLSYYYEKGEVTTWGTRLPNLVGVMKCPKWDTDETCGEIKVKGDNIVVSTASFTFLEKNFFKIFEFDEIVHVNPQLLKNIFNEHEEEMVKVYLEKDYPVCLEFMGIKNLRYYVAPLDV